MKDRFLLILIPLIIILLLLTALKFKEEKKHTKILSKKEKFVLIYKKLKDYRKNKPIDNQYIDNYKENILKKYSITQKEWNNFLYKLNKNKNYLKNYLDLLESR